jgi:YHS domain-containing protein
MVPARPPLPERHGDRRSTKAVAPENRQARQPDEIRFLERNSCHRFDRYLLPVPNGRPSPSPAADLEIPFGVPLVALRTVSMPALLSHFARRLTTAAMIVALVLLGAATAQAGIPWHGTLEQAKAASQISRRPVLAVFGASWSEASVALHERTLTNAEVVAIVTACFEPVKIDVDVDPVITKKMGVTYLPSACVIGPEDRVLASFDCADTPASFVAAVGKAAQESAVALSGQGPAGPAPVVASATLPPAAAFGNAPARYPSSQPEPEAVAQLDRPADTEAFRPLSSFSQAVEATSPPPAAEAPASRPWTTAPADAAVAPPARDTWLPEKASAGVVAESPRAPWSPSSTATSPSPPRPTVEPSPATPPAPPAAAASWLAPPAASTDLPATASATPSPQTAPQATPPGAVTYGITAPPPAAAKTPTVEETKPAAPNPFVAAFQKPFRFFTPAPQVEKAKPSDPPPVPAAGATDSHGTMPLGLEGYCPVTLAEKGQWVEGRAQWGARHRGRTYLFAGEPQQRAFLADPDRYAPALSGDDAVVAFDSGKSVPGQRRYGVTYQSRMYLFSSPETRTTFSANPERYVARVTIAENPASPSGTIRR